MKPIFLFITLLLLCSCSQTTKVETKLESTSNEQKLTNIIALYQIYYEQSSPFNKNEVAGNNAKLPDLSPENLANNNKKISKIYHQLLSLNTESLTAQNKINWAVLTYAIKNILDNYQNKEHYLPLTAESGFHVWISRINQKVNFKQTQDYQDYLSRLRELPRYFDQQIAWMEQGINEGITQPAVVLNGFEQSISAFIKSNARDSTYFQPFTDISKYVSAKEQLALQAEAEQVILTYVIPSYKKYYQFMTTRYKPNARKNIAATSLPNGKHYYQNRIEHYTTLKLSADEIHHIGLTEVARIRAEMDDIITSVNFKGNFADFIQFLRTDEQFYAKTPRELLMEASFIAKKMDAKLPSLFKTLPRTPYGVIAVPANIAPKYTTGRYSGPVRKDQPGNYWVNTYRLERRPLYVLPALTLHEAVPGHHLQGAIASEINNVPEFRKRIYISAFGEGWGLYAEYLGVEAGIYQDPYSNFGRLTYEMWRACRLVVDTGIHTKGWSRQQAMDYLANNTALSLHNVETEIDRYISWPGQALSYKLGELTIKRLRKEAESQLGDNFDVRDFHDQLLKNGSMPLLMLEKVIRVYIQEKQNTLKNSKA